MISYDDLVMWFEQGSKSSGHYRIGAEHEKFPFYNDSGKSVLYRRDDGRDIESLLKSLCYLGWKEVYEGENVIALRHEGGASITLEPAGQLELSGALKRDLHEICEETRSHIRDVVREGEKLGISLLGLGFAPDWKLSEVSIMPKQRYAIMRNYMPKVGKLGLDMMHRSCTIQVNLDYSCEADMAKKMRVGMALQGMVGALFSNSPFVEGRPSEYLSYRLRVWREVDKDRCGLVRSVFSKDFGFADWVDYLLDVPMYFLKRSGFSHDVTGKSFRDLMEGKLSGFEGEYATMSDWEEHVSVAFPDVRLKRYIEMRGADAGTLFGLCGLPAIWVGLLYDKVVLEDVYRMVYDWEYDEVDDLASRVSFEGMKAEFRNRKVKEWLEDVVSFAKEGLRRRSMLDRNNEDERIYLTYIESMVKEGRCPAEVVLDSYYNSWDEDISRVYDELKY